MGKYEKFGGGCLQKEEKDGIIMNKNGFSLR